MRKEKTKLRNRLLAFVVAVSMILSVVPIQTLAGTEGLLADIVADDDYRVVQIGDGVAVRASSGSGTFQNLPDYLKGLYFVQYYNNWPEVITATAKQDCYFYALVSESNVAAMQEQGFVQVATFAKSDMINGWMSCSATLYLMEKQVAQGDRISYGAAYGAWGTLMTSADKLFIKKEGLLAELSGYTASPAIGQLEDGAEVLYPGIGQTNFQNLPDYLKGLYFAQHRDWTVMTAKATDDCYFYVLTSEADVAAMKAQGFTQVKTFVQSDIMTGYFVSKPAFSSTLYLLEREMAKGESITYRNNKYDGTHTYWGTVITSYEQIEIPVEETVLDGSVLEVTGAEGASLNYSVVQLDDGVLILHKNTAGGTAFQNLPEYLKGLYFIQGLTFDAVEATVNADCYAYMLASEELADALKQAGFVQVAHYEKADIMTGYYTNKTNVSNTLFLMEKQVANGDRICYGDGSHWGTLILSEEQLAIPAGDNEPLKGLMVKVTKHAGDEGPYLVAQMADGETIIHPNVAGGTVFQNLPEYLKGLYFVQNCTLMGFEAQAKADGYIYILADENLLDELTAAGFTQVANYKTADKITGYYADNGKISEVMYLMEKSVAEGDVVSWGKEYGNIGILMTSTEKLTIPASDNKPFEGLQVKVAKHEGDNGPYLVAQMADGETIIHPNVAGGTVFQNLPEYLKGLYFVQNCTLMGFEATAKTDGYVYILADEDLLDELTAAGFKQVANYKTAEKITGYYANNGTLSEVLYLMEKAVVKGDIISWGKEYGNIGIFMTATKKLTIPASDNKPYEGLLVKVTKHAEDKGPYLVAQMADGEFVLHPGVSIGNTFKNLPEYLKGLYFVQNCNEMGLQATAKKDCYVYVLALENVAIELSKEGFIYVAKYGEGEIGEGSHMSRKMYLMEMKLAKGKTISYGEKSGEWGILMTSPTKLSIPEIEPDYTWLSNAYYYNKENGGYYVFGEDKTVTYTKDGAVQKGTYRIINPELTTFGPTEEDVDFDLTIEITMNDKTEIYDYPYFTFTDDGGTEYERLGTYKILFETGAGSAIESQTLNAYNGYLPTIPENSVLEGNTFEAWYTADGEEFDFENMVTESVTLYAKWSDTDYTQTTGQAKTFGALPYIMICIVILGAASGCGVFIVKRGKNSR